MDSGPGGLQSMESQINTTEATEHTQALTVRILGFHCSCPGLVPG